MNFILMVVFFKSGVSREWNLWCFDAKEKSIETYYMHMQIFLWWNRFLLRFYEKTNKRKRKIIFKITLTHSKNIKRLNMLNSATTLMQNYQCQMQILGVPKKGRKWFSQQDRSDHFDTKEKTSLKQGLPWTQMPKNNLIQETSSLKNLSQNQAIWTKMTNYKLAPKIMKTMKQKPKEKAKENTNVFLVFYFLRKQQNLFQESTNYQIIQIINLSKQETSNSLTQPCHFHDGT